MHHIVPEHLRLFVPYVCRSWEECNEANFLEYAKRYGLDVDALVARGGDVSEAEVDHIAATLQAWLVFGLLRRLLEPSGIRLDESDFLFPDKSNVDAVPHAPIENRAASRDHGTISTHRLTVYLTYLMALECHMNDRERQERLWAQHSITFNLVNSVVNKLTGWRRAHFPLDRKSSKQLPLLDGVLLSVILLSESLLDAYELLFARYKQTMEWHLDNALQWLLIKAGWCVGEINVLQDKTERATSMYILSSVDLHRLKKNNSLCTERDCLANQIDEDTYKSKHFIEGCPCSHVGERCTGDPHVKSILSSNSVPVIQIESRALITQGTGAITVTDSVGKPYVAISHVWSDGLGNVAANTLPQCQLVRIQRYVNDLYPPQARPVPFWIDTICVPRQKDLRRKAIWLMAQTYRNADKVLVIDSWLSQSWFLRHQAVDLLRIKACTWTQRLWTLHESVLARHDQLYFVTAGGALSETELLPFRASYQQVLYYSENFLCREHDKLQRSNPRILQILFDFVEKWDTTQIKAENCGSSDEVSQDDAWIMDYLLFQNLYSWYVQGFVYTEGKLFFQDLRSPRDHDLVAWAREAPRTQASKISKIGYSMRYRSTSQTEDEPICLATLLGYDPQDLLAATTMEGRMELLFSRIKHVPTMLLFSPTSRLCKDGLRWAPMSFRAVERGKGRLPGDTRTLEPGRPDRVGTVQPEGLLAGFEAVAIDTENASTFTTSNFVLAMGSQRLMAKRRKTFTKLETLAIGAFALVVHYTAADLAHSHGDTVLVAIRKIESEVTFAVPLSLWYVGPGAATDMISLPCVKGEHLPLAQWCIG